MYEEEEWKFRVVVVSDIFVMLLSFGFLIFYEDVLCGALIWGERRCRKGGGDIVSFLKLFLYN